MKIKVTRAFDHKIGPAATQHFRVRDEPYDVPRATGEKAIARGDATAVETQHKKGVE